MNRSCELRNRRIHLIATGGLTIVIGIESTDETRRYGHERR
jgi:hypothetical protein